MDETIAQYSARIAGYVKGKEPLAVQSETAGTLASLIAGLPNETLSQAKLPGKWSLAEILAHLADAELVSTWRYRQMIENNGGPLASFDQLLWARLGGYAEADPRGSLATFKALRQANLAMFQRLTPAEWERFGVHAERGKMTLLDLATQIAGHDLNHLAQVKQILAKE